VEGSIKNFSPRGLLYLFSKVDFQATIADDVKRTRIELAATFKDFAADEQLYRWLSKRKAVVTVARELWKDALGNEHDGTSLQIAVETSGKEAFARLNPVTTGLEDHIFSALAATLTLAPIVVTSTTPVKAQPEAVANDENASRYFRTIGGPQRLATLFPTMLAGWFFKKAVAVDEVRVVGIGLRRQPALVNDPAPTPKDAFETALLFDYETDFHIALPSPDLKTAKPISTRIDGTGFRVIGGDFSWVQVPRGLHELMIGDPGLWELGALGKFLKIVELSLRLDGSPKLVLRLHLSGNWGVLTASDFILTIDLKSGAAAVESFPSEIRIEDPGSYKAVGKLYIDDEPGAKEMRGSLDVVLSTGWRAYAGTRIAHLKTDGGEHEASISSLRIEWPTLVPVFSTGIGVKAVDGIFATHFARAEFARSPAVPPDLVWLQKPTVRSTGRRWTKVCGSRASILPPWDWASG
jgi:hypothetical protein